MTQVDSWDLKKWRKKFGYNQFEAAEKLGVNRGAVQNWEREIRPVPKAVELACEELNQFAKRHPGFGPVLLVYTDPVGRSKSPGYGHLKLPHSIIAVSAAEQR